MTAQASQEQAAQYRDRFVRPILIVSTPQDKEYDFSGYLYRDPKTREIVGAVGGMGAAKDGLQALVDGTYSGKVLIFPQIHDLPLMGLDELKDRLPALNDIIFHAKARNSAGVESDELTIEIRVREVTPTPTPTATATPTATNTPTP